MSDTDNNNKSTPGTEDSSGGDSSVVDIEQLPLQLSIFEPEPVVRPEYNIGKFAGIIFVSPYAKNLDKPRKHEWRVKRGDEEVTASLTITPLYGSTTPTTTTLRVYLALLQAWTHSGQPADGVVNFSARQLAAIIGWKWSGSDTAKRIAHHVGILKSTGLTWILSYLQANGTLERKVSDISILATADYNERKTLFKDERFSPVQRVRFNPDLVDNMLKGHVRPLNYDALRGIANDTTLNLYTRLDIYLSKKTRWERRSIELFRLELGLEGKRYEKRFARRAKLRTLIAELDGVELCHGRLKVWMEETKDGTDDKLVAVKVPRIEPKDRAVLKPVTGKEEAELLAEDVIRAIKSQPRGGNPKPEFILYICRMYPTTLIHQALSIAKADYQGKVTKTVAHVFVYELRRLVRDAKGLTWHGDVPRKAEKSQSA